MLIIETRAFTRQVRTELDVESYRLLQLALAQNPQTGALIRGTGGLRKVRWAAKGRGKRGGARVIYYWHRDRDLLLMLVAFGKSDEEDLTKEQEKKLSALVREELK